jgi:hypothetical protein
LVEKLHNNLVTCDVFQFVKRFFVRPFSPDQPVRSLRNPHVINDPVVGAVLRQPIIGRLQNADSLVDQVGAGSHARKVKIAIGTTGKHQIP